MATQVFNVQVTISDAQQKNLRGNTAVQIQEIAQSSVTKVLDGGMVIPPPAARRIEKIMGPSPDGLEIARRIERAVGKDGDNIVVEMTVDPVFVEGLQEKANCAGTSIKQLAGECLSHMLFGGILLEIPTEVWSLQFTPDQISFLRNKLECGEEPLFGEKVARALGWQPTVTEEETPFETKVA